MSIAEKLAKLKAAQEIVAEILEEYRTKSAQIIPGKKASLMKGFEQKYPESKQSQADVTIIPVFNGLGVTGQEELINFAKLSLPSSFDVQPTFSIRKGDKHLIISSEWLAANPQHKHKLALHSHEGPVTTCDICKKSFPKGTKVNGCHLAGCDYDECGDCTKKRKEEFTKGLNFGWCPICGAKSALTVNSTSKTACYNRHTYPRNEAIDVERSFSGGRRKTRRSKR